MNPDRGSVFDVLLGLVRRGLGGAMGDGGQFVSWIHHEDFVRATQFLLERDDLAGAVNMTSPGPVPNAEFMREFRRAWGAPFGIPAPAGILAIGALFLRTETELILKSRRVVPSRLLASGFEFKFPGWPGAAKELCAEWRSLRRGTN
jgi:NAD dependent epimerase/dehydratase family enzyme